MITARKYSSTHKNVTRANERDIGDPPPVKNVRRKRQCRKSWELYCMTYFDYLFTHPFTEAQRAWGNAIVTGIFEGGWRAEAAPRGDGKTTICKGVLTWAVNYGYLRFPVFFGANSTFAGAALADIRLMYERSEALAEDFPEICYPVKCLEGAPQRANMQTSSGERTLLQWSGDEIIMPTIKATLKTGSAGAILSCKGIDAAIRGMIKNGQRPDFAVLDDVETRDSAHSFTETKKRIETIEQDVVGLAGQGKRLSIAMLCTIIKKGCAADQFTDRKEKPAWQGNRRKWLIDKPVNEEIWQKYIEMRQADQIEGNGTGPTAHKFYLANRAEMDVGAKISNPYRFDAKFESSALESCYNKIADVGWDSFACEYQNEPPDEELAETSGLNRETVCKKLNNLDHGIVPHWCEKLTAFIDVHGRTLVWCIVAWKQGMQGYVIDYGMDVVHSPTGSLVAKENQEALDSAILTALMGWRDWEAQAGWPIDVSGEVRHIDLCLVDAGYKPDIIDRFVRISAGGQYRASMGYGSTQTQRYKAPRKSTALVKVGNHYHLSQQPTVKRLWSIDADYFKNSVHNGILAPADVPGSIALYGKEPVAHRRFADQICAEIWTREFVGGAGRGFKEYFNVKSRHNHWLDCMAGCIAGAVMLGIRLLDVIPGGGKKKRRVGRMNSR